ncbi:uncharacterized protein LOC105841035 [Monomorium pharaonis]|uniref:uncharacterized protein LOC105841035 n=1 Tax=Monomorium pharaonis TaxID=307658 RepID=UPI00063EF38C|nr:uncharacterized protein LOC105841035 [Monomorium pharaonis]
MSRRGPCWGPCCGTSGTTRSRRLPPPSCGVVCYADDTIVVVGGSDWGKARRTAEQAVQQVVRAIEVARKKTEALYSHRVFVRDGPPPTERPWVLVGNTPVQIGPYVKYLGLILDGSWSFGEHFRWLALRFERATTALGRLLPNVGGPGARRHMAIRAARTYRMTFHALATTLSGMPPLDLVARAQARVYERARQIRQGSETVMNRVRPLLRLQAQRSLIEEWRARLSSSGCVGQWTVGALAPVLADWLDRGWGRVSFRMAQVFTGYRCFEKFLCRIRRECTTRCHHCPVDTGKEGNTALHTLATCPAWKRERGVLRARLMSGEDLSLGTLVRAILRDESTWEAAFFFCHVKEG